jgi:tRNA modification GTPase
LRAEALLDVIHAGSERALRLAHANLGGRLGEAVSELERRAVAVLAELEGRIDFPEADLDVAEERWVDDEIGALVAGCRELADGYRHGRAVASGIVIALVGPVNTGKSSLLNAIVGRERALVDAAPGTTRDFLEVADVWDGVAVTLVDTAGTRDGADAVEARGVALGEARVASADVVVVVNDERARWDDGARYGTRAVVVRSKVDLGGADAGIARVRTSARTGEGLDELKRCALAVAGIADREGGEPAFLTTARQQAAVVDAGDAFGAARAARVASAVMEVIALELRRGTRALARLRGIDVGERVLDEVFARFCIGK